MRSLPALLATFLLFGCSEADAPGGSGRTPRGEGAAATGGGGGGGGPPAPNPKPKKVCAQCGAKAYARAKLKDGTAVLMCKV